VHEVNFVQDWKPNRDFMARRNWLVLQVAASPPLSWLNVTNPHGSWKAGTMKQPVLDRVISIVCLASNRLVWTRQPLAAVDILCPL
jgi:hypothetical protein